MDVITLVLDPKILIERWWAWGGMYRVVEVDEYEQNHRLLLECEAGAGSGSQTQISTPFE
jgi:hypothetical protein